MLLSYITWIVMCFYTPPAKKSILNFVDGMFAIAIILSFFRVVYLCQITRYLGLLQLCLGKMVQVSTSKLLWNIEEGLYLKHGFKENKFIKVYLLKYLNENLKGNKHIDFLNNLILKNKDIGNIQYSFYGSLISLAESFKVILKVISLKSHTIVLAVFISAVLYRVNISRFLMIESSMETAYHVLLNHSIEIAPSISRNEIIKNRIFSFNC